MNSAVPTISWIPVRIFSAVLEEKTLTVEQWLHSARHFGLSAIELYHPFLKCLSLEKTRALLDELDLRVSLVTCSPDISHPEPSIRQMELNNARQALNDAAALGASGIRCTTGQAHPGLEESEGLKIVSEGLISLAEEAQSLGVKVALENHYRDRMCMEFPDFAHKKEVFFKLWDLVKASPVAINLDCSNPVMVGDSPLEIMDVVGDRIISIHASDRKSGTYLHTSIGDGDVDYPAVFARLKEMNYSGWISIEDGQPNGDAGFQKSLDYVRGLVGRFWPEKG